MYNYLIRLLTKNIYKVLIYNTIILDDSSTNHYSKIEPFCIIEIPTTSGMFKFQFKKDRRKSRRNLDSFPNIANYIIQLIIPDELKYTNKYLSDIVVVVVKVAFCKPNYEILTEVLSDKYLTSILNRIEKASITV